MLSRTTLPTASHLPKGSAESATAAAATLWLHADGFFALAARRDRPRELTDRLLTVATWPAVVVGYPRWNDAITAVLADPQLTDDDVHRLGSALNPHQPHLLEGFGALLAHAACTDRAVASVLIPFAHVPALGDYDPLADLACRHASLVPAAITLTRRESPTIQRHDHEVAAVAVAAQLAGYCGSDPEVCNVVTALAGDWIGELHDLARAARGISGPSAAA